MSALRVLGFCYLGTASLLALAMATADKAQLRASLDGAGATVSHSLDKTVWRSIHEFTRAVDMRLFDPPQRQAVLELAQPEPEEERGFAHATLPPISAKRLTDQKIPEEEFVALPPLLTIAPDLPALETKGRVAPDERATAVRGAVLARLERRLTPDLRANFDLFLYISKAATGPAAQRLYVFKKDDGGKLQLLYDWAASTGREAYETSPEGRHVFTATPSGLYQFDPARLYRHYVSRAWDGEMPFAMFLDWEHQGRKSGVAVHAATGSGIARLGKRTSAGCVHLSPGHAALLFKLIRADYKGKVPRFAYDPQSRSSSNRGELMRDAAGSPVMTDGYRVLVDIEEYSGADVFASL